MAVKHLVFGACSVWWGPEGGTLVKVGYSRDGVSIRIEPRWGDIQSDDFGGEGGVPADSQFLGASATITAELTKYEDGTQASGGSGGGVTSNLSSFINAASTLGTMPGLGTLVRGTALEGELVLTTGASGEVPVSGDHVITFTNSFLRGAQEVNKGTKYSTYIASWEAWANTASGQVLFTDVVTT